MNMNAIMQQAQMMQKKLAKAEAELENEIHEFDKGNGAIKLKIRGNLNIEELKIDADLLESDSKEILEDMLVIGLNEALSQVLEIKERKMSAITGNIKIPGM